MLARVMSMLPMLWAPATLATTITERSLASEPGAPVRYYLTVEPEGYLPGAPAVALLHGGGQSMTEVLEPARPTRRWLDLAERHGFLLLVPNGFNADTQSGAGENQTWNDLRPSSPGVSEQDDVAFLETMLDAEAARFAFDPAAVAVVGSSNGGMMAYRLLIERPDRFAAGVAFIANLPEAAVPPPAEPTPVMIVNGDTDPLMPWDGGIVGAAGAPVRSTPATVGYWTAALGADPAPGNPTALPDLAADGTRIFRFDYASADAMTPSVRLYRVVGGGHAIPIREGDEQIPLPPSMVGVQSRDARGIDLAWSFITSHLPSRSPADLSGDGLVDAADLAMLLAAWGQPGASDLDADGATGAADLAALLAAWGSEARERAFIPAR